MTVPSTFKLGYPSLKYAMTPCMLMDRNPTTSDLNHPTVGGFYPIPTIWVNKTNGNAYILSSITSGTTANWVAITAAAAGAVIGPGLSVDNALARFDGTTGKVIQNSAVTMADTTGTMTFPAGGGVVLTTGGAAARKGTATFTAGSSGAIATTAVAANSAIVVTRTNLAGAAAATGFYVTITPGVSFIVTSGDAADTSAFTWAIVG